MKRGMWKILLLALILASVPAGTSAAEAPAVAEQPSEQPAAQESATAESEQEPAQPVVKEEPETTKALKNGWYGSYYYKNGKKLTGLQKIKKKYYIFNAKGKLVKNKIAYSVKVKKKTRYFDIDKKGVAKQWTGVYDLAAKRLAALKAIPKKTTESKRLASLKKAFLWSAELKYRDVNYTGLSDSKALAKFGTYGFEREMGECTAQAATFAAMAKVLRYDSKLMRGYILAQDEETGVIYHRVHAWAQIKIGKTLYAFDPNFNTSKLAAALKAKNKYVGFRFTYGSKGTLKYFDSKKKSLQ